MAVPTARTDLSTTASSNPPAGTDAIGTSHDDHMRAQYKFIRENYDDIQLKANIASPTFTGTVTGPGYTVTGSSVPANGIYLSAANTFAISSNSTVRYSVNSTGGHSFATPSSGTTTLTASAANLGTTDGNSTEIASFIYASGNVDRLSFIGYRRDNASDWTTAETRIQRVVDSDPHGFIAFGDGGQGTAAGTQGLILGGGNNDAVFIAAGGNVTVAAPSSGTTLVLDAAFGDTNLLMTGATVNLAAKADGSGSISYFGNTSNHPLAFITNNTERARIAANGDATFNGSVTSPDFVETSARSLKENIAEAEAGALERIQSLTIKEFEFSADESRRKRVGVIADEIPARYSVNGEAVSITAVLFDMVKAVQELAAKVDELSK